MIIGITGGSGTGKSLASEFFKENGFLVIDFDKISRDVSKKGSDSLRELHLVFGDAILNPDGTLSRKKLGEIVFSDKEKLAILNEITHKYIIKEAIKIKETTDAKNIIYDAPLLFEAGLDRECDFVISVLADKEKRIERIMKRDSISMEYAKRRIESQKCDEFYIEKSDFSVYNNGDKDAFLSDLSKILRSKLDESVNI